MERSKAVLKHRLAASIQQLQTHALTHSLKEWSELELSLPQFRGLLLLHRGPQRMSDVAAHFSRGLSAATSLVTRLVDKGLVERISDTEDRRVVRCRLTARGQEEVDRFQRMEQMRLERLVELLSVQELEQIAVAMELLAKAVQSLAAEDSDAAEPASEKDMPGTLVKVLSAKET